MDIHESTIGNGRGALKSLAHSKQWHLLRRTHVDGWFFRLLGPALCCRTWIESFWFIAHLDATIFLTAMQFVLLSKGVRVCEEPRICPELPV